MKINPITYFSEIKDNYDAFILDLWGVIHDGRELYAGAKECLERLRASGKKIVLLSNAPRRAADAAGMLERMGVTKDSYDALVTSGETAHQCLAAANSPIFRPRGKRYVYFGLPKDRGILDDIHYEQVDAPEEADFLLLSHSNVDNQPLEELAPLLARGLKAELPALCINPDMEVVRQTGERVYCAGVLAADYAAKGGKVIYFGKPHKIVYDVVFSYFKGITKSRILAVGDSLLTDIRGAQNNGVKSVLVTGGILKQVLGEPGTTHYDLNLQAICNEFGASPDFVMPAFNW